MRRGRNLLCHVCVEENPMRRGRTPTRHVCVEENTTPRGRTPSCRVCVDENTTMGRGFPPLVASVWKETRQEGVPPPLVAPVWKETMMGRGFPQAPSRCVSGGSRQPTRSKTSGLVLVFEGDGLVVVAAVTTTLENERLCSFSRAVDGGVTAVITALETEHRRSFSRAVDGTYLTVVSNTESIKNIAGVPCTPTPVVLSFLHSCQCVLVIDKLRCHRIR